MSERDLLRVYHAARIHNLGFFSQSSLLILMRRFLSSQTDAEEWVMNHASLSQENMITIHDDTWMDNIFMVHRSLWDTDSHFEKKINGLFFLKLRPAPLALALTLQQHVVKQITDNLNEKRHRIVPVVITPIIMSASESSTCILNVMSENDCTDLFEQTAARSSLTSRSQSDLRTCIFVIAHVDIHIPCDMPIEALYEQTMAGSSEMLLDYYTRRLPKNIPGFPVDFATGYGHSIMVLQVLKVWCIKSLAPA